MTQTARPFVVFGREKSVIRRVRRGLFSIQCGTAVILTAGAFAAEKICRAGNTIASGASFTI